MGAAGDTVKSKGHAVTAAGYFWGAYATLVAVVVWGLL